MTPDPIFITLSIAVNALRRNAMRTALTALGMIIGVAAVIVMVAIGHGAQSSIEERIRSAGTNDLATPPRSRQTTPGQSRARSRASTTSHLA
jgi:putative ABC transport system permease protein